MKFDLEAKFFVNDDSVLTPTGVGAVVWLCFKHAVIRTLANEDVKIVIDEFGGEYDGRRYYACYDCDPENYF